MAKETALFTVKVQISDRDYDDVFRIYLEQERGKEKKIALGTCVFLAVICLILVAVFHNPTFIFYAIACLIIGGLYCIVPANRKFVAQNKLQFGEKREIGFLPHSLSTFELLDDEEDLTDEAREEATTYFSTGTMFAYENERGFLFAEGKISNQFLYIPKRNLDETEIETVREYAKKRCSGGYQYMQMRSMLADPEDDADDTEGGSFVSAVCDQYYGADRLHLKTEDGRRVKAADFAEADDDADDAHTEVMDAPEMDVDAELEKILSEDEDD